MHILMLRPHMQIGGVESHIHVLARELILRGHRVSLATNAGGAVDRLPGLGVSVVPTSFHPLNPFNFARAVLQLSSVVRTTKVDVMHSHNRLATIIGRIVSRMTRVPLLVTVHEFEFKRDWRWLASTWTGTITITPCMALGDRLQERYSIPRSHLRVIPNAVDSTVSIDPVRLASIRQQLGYDSEVPWVGFVSRLVPEKGCHFFVESMPLIRQQYPGVRFIIAGSGPEEPALRQRAHCLGLDVDRIFIGPRSDSAELMTLLDILVLPSVSDNAPLIILEAMRAGRPVVASAVGGIPELVRDGVTGLLVPPESPSALARAIAVLIAQPARRHLLGAQGHQIFLECFVPPVLTDQIMLAYSDAILRMERHQS